MERRDSTPQTHPYVSWTTSGVVLIIEGLGSGDTVSGRSEYRVVSTREWMGRSGIRGTFPSDTEGVDTLGVRVVGRPCPSRQHPGHRHRLVYGSRLSSESDPGFRKGVIASDPCLVVLGRGERTRRGSRSPTTQDGS